MNAKQRQRQKNAQRFAASAVRVVALRASKHQLPISTKLAGRHCEKCEATTHLTKHHEPPKSEVDNPRKCKIHILCVHCHAKRHEPGMTLALFRAWKPPRFIPCSATVPTRTGLKIIAQPGIEAQDHALRVAAIRDAAREGWEDP